MTHNTTCNKAYLIVFSYGKRYIEEFSMFESERPGFSPEDMRKGLTDLIPRHTTFTGISQLIMSFTLVGKHKIKGKKTWNEFLDKLKVRR